MEQHLPLDSSHYERESQPFAIIPTRIPGLDTLLGGGIPEGNLMLVVGAPGTGKTLLAQQICFNMAAAGAGRTLYFSTLSEPHDKMIRQIQSFRFFDPHHLGDSVMLLALQEFLKQGLEATAEVIMRTTRQQQARLVCIDGFRAIEAVCSGELEARQFLYQLSSQLSLLGATVLVTLERSASERDDYGAYTIADSVLACHHELLGIQRWRKVEIRKSRAIAHLHGLHSYRIDRDGWTVSPRIETLVTAETNAPPRTRTPERMAFGLPDIDRMLGGGLPSGSTTLVVGGPGVGKTLLGLHYLSEGVRHGQPSLFVGFGERRDQLIDKARHFGLPFAEGADADLLSIRTFAPVEVEPDQISTVIRHEVATRGIQRLVIDATLELERATVREGRSYDYFGALVTYLRDAGVTVCMARLINSFGIDNLDFSNTPLSVVAENLLLLRQLEYDGKVHRAISVLKMRDSDYDQRVYEYVIGPAGLAIAGRFEPVGVPGISNGQLLGRLGLAPTASAEGQSSEPL